MGSKIEVPIFTDTNLGTRIAVSVPPDIAARDFKRKLEAVHSKCFPLSGEIEICGLMVKRKSCYYHITDSVPMKKAFEGLRGTWFLRVEARTSSEFFEPYISNPATEDIDRVSNVISITEPLGPTGSITSTDTKGEKVKECHGREFQTHKPSLEERTRLVYVSQKSTKKKREKKNRSSDHRTRRDGSEKIALLANRSSDHEQPLRSATDDPSEMFSEVKSVSSIIRRYFPNSNEKTGFSSPTSSEATSRHKSTKTNRSGSSLKVKSFPKLAKRSRSKLLHSPASPSERALKGSVNRAEIGERLAVATINLGLFSSEKKSPIHLCKKARYREASSLIRLSVFDISDSDD